MRVMVVGSGAREHAIAAALKDSPSGVELHGFMSSANPGIIRLADKYALGDICSPSDVSTYASNNKIDLAVIGPEAPLAAGVVDALEEEGVLCVGPRKKPAQLESDKSFARNLMRNHKIAGAPVFGVFDDPDTACRFIDDFGGDLAVKPAGLTGGKGVKITGEHFDAAGAKTYVKEIFDAGMGGIRKVILEERLIGEEFTLQGFVDGKHVVGTPMVQDHKRAYEGDVGPNTGGMGSYSDRGYILPFLSRRDYDDALEIMEDTVKAVREETGEEYRGFLYGQFMATRDGVKVVEYNARLGDPEAMNTLSILESDMQRICEKIGSGSLGGGVEFREKATVCKYTVPAGYPDNPRSDVEVTVDEENIGGLGGLVYYASVRIEGGRILTSKSRAVAVVGVQDTIAEAEEVAEKCMQHIRGDLKHRRDIGTKALIDRRIMHMRDIRGR